MKQLIVIFVICISGLCSFAQPPGAISKIRSGNDGTMGLDTNKLAIDDKGNKLQFYQYKQLLLSGYYAVSTRIINGIPANEYLLVKKDEQQNLQIYEMVKKQMAIKSAMLQEGNKLSIEPLTHLIKAEEFDGKAIVLIFFTTNCEQCNMGLKGLDSFFKQVYDPKKMIIVAINNHDQQETYDQLKLTPLPNARIIYDASKIKENYWIPTTNAFVVTDKDHIIRFAVSASGGIAIPIFKSKITEVSK